MVSESRLLDEVQILDSRLLHPESITCNPVNCLTIGGIVGGEVETTREYSLETFKPGTHYATRE